MNLFKRIFGAASPTRDWVADATIPLSVDLGARRFCGVELGADITRLKHLGASSNRRGRYADTMLVYKEQGFQLFLNERQCLEAVDFNLVAEEGLAAFMGSWFFQGRRVSIEASQTPEQIEVLLGAADQKVDERGVALCYQNSAGDLWFEWGENGSLEFVMLDKSVQQS